MRCCTTRGRLPCPFYLPTLGGGHLFTSGSRPAPRTRHLNAGPAQLTARDTGPPRRNAQNFVELNGPVEMMALYFCLFVHLFVLTSRVTTLLLSFRFHILRLNQPSPSPCDGCAVFWAVTFLPLSTAPDVRWPVVPGGRRRLLQDQAGPSPGRHRVWGRQGNPTSHRPAGSPMPPWARAVSPGRPSALYAGAPEASPGPPQKCSQSPLQAYRGT